MHRPGRRCAATGSPSSPSTPRSTSVALRGTPIGGRGSRRRARSSTGSRRARAGAASTAAGGWTRRRLAFSSGRHGADARRAAACRWRHGSRWSPSSVDAGPLLAVAALSDRLPPALRRWLQPRAAATCCATSRSSAGAAGRCTRARGSRRSASIPSVTRPACAAWPGSSKATPKASCLQLDAARAGRVRLAQRFRRGARDSRSSGAVTGWREGAGWRVGTAALRIDGDGFGANARGGLWWQGDGTRPWIDIAADARRRGAAGRQGVLDPPHDAAEADRLARHARWSPARSRTAAR